MRSRDLEPTGAVVVVGSLVVDLVARTEERPRPGQTVIGTGGGVHPGGKGLNQAIQAARLGAEVRLVGRLGADPLAEVLQRAMAEAGLPAKHVSVDPEAPTAQGHIVVDGRGQNAIVLLPGASARLTPAEVRRADGSIRTARLLMLQLEVPLEANREAARIAAEAGVPVLLDPAPVPAEPPWDLIEAARVITPNEGEAARLVGGPVASPADALAAARALRSRGPAVVITLGERGAVVADGEGAEHLPPHPVRAVDSTGAGDAFAGALATALASGWPLRAAARLGVVAGALAAARIGAAPSLPGRRELLRAAGLPGGPP